jgi:hypothetical protein
MKTSKFNKLLIAIGLFGCFALVYSCKEEVKNDTSDEVSVDDDYYEFQDYNLSEYDIEAYISLPDETANIGASTKPEITHVEDDILWNIKVGQNFHLVIEDYGEITDLVEVEKKELAEQDLFNIEYLVEEDDLIVYKRTLMVKGSEQAAPTVGVEHTSYHVYGQKTVGEITYELRSREDGYEKMIIELMAKSIKSITPIEEK